MSAQPDWLTYTPEETERARQELEADRIFSDIDQVLARRAETKLREVLLEVIDDGNGELDGRRLPWDFDHIFADVANKDRIDFVDTVIERLRRKK